MNPIVAICYESLYRGSVHWKTFKDKEDKHTTNFHIGLVPGVALKFQILLFELSKAAVLCTKSYYNDKSSRTV
jgi:hypothetical protein